MNRSKSVFIILAIVYVLVALGLKFEVLSVNNNILLGLSISALLISISDAINKYVYYRQSVNLFQFELQKTIDFLQNKIEAGLTNSPVVNIRNFTSNLSILKKNNYNPYHPNDYDKNKINKSFHIIAFIIFVLGIAAFISIPFIKENIANTSINMLITILAFASMNLTLYFDEIIQEEQDKRINLTCDKHLLIQCVYSDFLNYFQAETIFLKDTEAIKEMQEKHQLEVKKKIRNQKKRKVRWQNKHWEKRLSTILTKTMSINLSIKYPERCAILKNLFLPPEYGQSLFL